MSIRTNEIILDLLSEGEEYETSLVIPFSLIRATVAERGHEFESMKLYDALLQAIADTLGLDVEVTDEDNR